MNRTWNRRDVLTAAGIGLSMLPLPATGSARGQVFPRGGEIRFRDMTGAEVVLPGPAQRIVDLFTVGTAFAIAAHGSPSRIVAVNTIAHGLFRRGLIGRFHPETLDIPDDFSITVAPNIERLVSLDPDVVVDFKQRARDNSRTLKNAGLKVALYTDIKGGVRKTIASLLLMYGEMIGDTTRAGHIITMMEEATARLGEIQSIPLSDRPSVVLMSPIEGRLYASGGGPGEHFSDSIYSAGGVNAAAELPGLTPIGVEQIMVWDPDVILLFQSQDTSPAMIYDHPVLRDSKAARTLRVYVLPIGTNNWGSMGPDEYLCSIWLAELLYPDRMDRKLRAEMRRAFTAILGHTLSDGDLDGVLRMDLNGNAAGYSRFLRDG